MIVTAVLFCAALAWAPIVLVEELTRSKETAMAETGPSTDIAALRRLMTLPEEPSGVRFELRLAPVKGEGAVCAELTYSQDAAGRILANAPVERPIRS